MQVTIIIDPASAFNAKLAWREPDPGLFLGQLTLEAAEAAPVPQVKLSFSHAVGDIQSLWTATGGMDKGLRWDWGSPMFTGPTSGTPVM